MCVHLQIHKAVFLSVSSFCIIIVTIFFFVVVVVIYLIRTCSAHSASTCVPFQGNIPDNNSGPRKLITFFSLLSTLQTSLSGLLSIKVRNVKLYYLGRKLSTVQVTVRLTKSVNHPNSLLMSPVAACS